jgi:hypothetical protein
VDRVTVGKDAAKSPARIVRLQSAVGYDADQASRHTYRQLIAFAHLATRTATRAVCPGWASASRVQPGKAAMQLALPLACRQAGAHSLGTK